jgi:hypothetical protein
MITFTGNGRLSRDVQLRTTRAGKTVATIAVACDRRDRTPSPSTWTSSSGRPRPRPPPSTSSRARSSASPDASSRVST